MDGKPLEFEVFKIRQAGGTEIFGKYYEEYEAYPGAAAFGKSAWSVNNLGRAEEIFEQLTSGESRPLKVKAIKLRKNPPGVRGRQAVKRPVVILPKKKFNMKDLLKANPVGWSQPTLYMALKSMLASRVVSEVERKSMGRGRPVVFYKKG
jgi:hypothetical protein